MKLSRFDFLDLNGVESTGTYIKPYAETGSTAANLKPYGVSVLSYSSAANLYTIDSPIPYVEKTVVLNSAVAADSTAIGIALYSGSTAKFFRGTSTAAANNLYINFLPPYASVTLMGLSTSEWLITGSVGQVQASTVATYST